MDEFKTRKNIQQLKLTFEIVKKVKKKNVKNFTETIKS